MENSKEPAFPFTWHNREGDECAESGLTKREFFASNAQNAIIGNADTLREITKATNSTSPKEREAAFLRVIARIAVQHADALLEALNE